MTTIETQNNKIDGIQYLRAVAILLTLFHHAATLLLVYPPPQLLFLIYSEVTFWVGVDLFFVISGFVIMKSFSESLEKFGYTAKTVAQFWIKRFFRIIPAAFLWLGIYLLFTIFYNKVGAFGNLNQNWHDSLAAILQYANLYGLNCWGPHKIMQCGPNGIYWSLSLEEQFYVVLPFLIFIFRKNLIFFLFANVLVQFFIFRPVWSLGWAIRTDALSWGVIIAMAFKKEWFQRFKPKFLQKQKWLSVAIFIILLGTLLYVPAETHDISVATGIVAIVAAIMVYLSVFNTAYLFPFKKLNRLLSWLGSRSYSLYLIHVVIFRLATEIVYDLAPAGYIISAKENVYLCLLALVMLIPISELNYRFIEGPFRKLGVRLSQKISSG